MAAISVVLLGVIGYIFLGGEKEPDFPMLGPAGAFTLPSADGEQVSMEESLGKVKLVYFFFGNCPDVCPPTSHMLSRVQDRLAEEGVFGKDAFIYQITIDPERDTPENLLKYANNMGADLNGWKFLRGTVEETKTVADGYNLFYMKDEETGLFSHLNLVFLVDQQNQIRRMYNGDSLDDELIAKEMMALIKS